VFVGHYGVSYAAKRGAPTVPLWVLFIAVQLLDVAWAPFVLLGIEKVRIVPGITKSNPLDLYYMPYTHSLLAASSGPRGHLPSTDSRGGPTATPRRLSSALPFSHTGCLTS